MPTVGLNPYRIVTSPNSALAVFCAMMRGIDREQIGRKLRLLETVGEHVRMRQRHLDPVLKKLTGLG